MSARLAGLELIRWGTRLLADLKTAAGEPKAAGRARELEQDVVRMSNALRAHRKVLRASVFAKVRIALDDPDPGFRVLAVIRLGREIVSRRRPWLAGRARHDAVCRLMAGLADDPDPDVRAAAADALRRANQ